MPKNIINYNNAVIYKIQHHEKLDLIYVGSTTDFTRRKAEHKRLCNNNKHDTKVYKMIRENEGWDAFKMIIIKEFPCESKIELLIEEDKIMIELKTSLNKNRAYITSEDERIDYFKIYRDTNKQKIKENDKAYYQKNRIRIIERCKQYQKTTKTRQQTTNI